MTTQVEDALGQYGRTLHVTAVGGRVYVEGELRNFGELQDALGLIRDVEGVTSVMDDVYLTEVGGEGPGDSAFD